VVGVKPRKREAVIVEVKLHDFRRALLQTEDRLFVGDYVYVAFPTPYAQVVLESHLDELDETGIGLLGLDGGVKELLPPLRSIYVNPERRSSLFEIVLGRGRR